MMLRVWLHLSLARWLYHGPYPLRALAAWWLPHWYAIGMRLGG